MFDNVSNEDLADRLTFYLEGKLFKTVTRKTTQCPLYLARHHTVVNVRWCQSIMYHLFQNGPNGVNFNRVK